MVIGPKEWTWGNQRGLRIFANPIRRLALELVQPDRRGRYRSLQEFIDTVNASGATPARPGVYSRDALIVRVGEVALRCTVSLSDNTDRRPAALGRGARPSLQGYVTASQDTWFHRWVASRLGSRLVFEYVPGTTRDVIVVP
jgi:hypothetical protein